MRLPAGHVGDADSSDAAVAVMEDLAAFAEKADRDWQERADGLEAEHQRLMAWLVEQSERDPLEGLG